MDGFDATSVPGQGDSVTHCNQYQRSDPRRQWKRYLRAGEMNLRQTPEIRLEFRFVEAFGTSQGLQDLPVRKEALNNVDCKPANRLVRTYDT